MVALGAQAIRFHGQSDVQLVKQLKWGGWNLEQYQYDFENFFHPLVGALITQLNNATGDPIEALLDPGFLARLDQPFFDTQYSAGNPAVSLTSHNRAIELDHQLPYANYNWELLYHIPVAVAVHLSQNQRFAEAQKWFHYVFDPTSKDLKVPAPARFWKFLYFRSAPPTLDLASLLALLSSPPTSDPAQAAQQQDVLTSYQASISTPFQPFAVARPRPVAFQYYVVMKYLDNLIAWGDSLFSQMTIETVNEATLCYVLATNLLGPRPQQVPAIGTTMAKSYNDLQAAGLDNLGDALVDLEAQFPFNITTSVPVTSSAATGPLLGMGRSLYFCIPQNAALLGYWDIVEDRLTKIRSCENLGGQVQLMPLFDPPIDPGMLVKAAAAGLDLGSVISGLNQPIGAVRSPLLIQKALELCAEVRSLGGGLLSAIEKRDAETIASLRQNNEIRLQQLSQGVRYLQWQQARASTDALARARATTYERYAFYLRLLGQEPDSSAAPPAVGIDHSNVITEDNFDDAFDTLVGQYDTTINALPYPPLQLAQSSSPATQSGASGTGQLYLNSNEDAELNIHMPAARTARLLSSVTDTVASVLALIPNFDVDLHFWGLGGHSQVFGGDKLSAVSKIGAEILRTTAAWEQDQGGMAARTAGYQRRAADWLLQANLAARELSATGRQLLTSLIAEQAARQEYESAVTQVGQSQEILTFLQTKFTNADLYGWMQGQLSNLYYQYYRFALDTARKAEATMKWELMRPEVDAVTYIQPNYFDSGHNGLLTGEALYLDLKRMELDYHAYNVRELELTRHVSLRQLDPLALLNLKAGGTCTITIPEWLYDRDCPGHYLRRIKSVAVSVPSVVGPYTSVNCTLALQHSTVRVSPLPAGGKYARDITTDDSRFVDYYGAVQSIVTSSAATDSGMFETNLRDERFLPFEGAGAVSTWTLALPAVPSFDYASITDVILQVRYTAREGGAALAALSTAQLHQMPPAPSGTDPAATLGLLISLRHDFPTEWYTFVDGTNDFMAALTVDFFPYAVQGTRLTLNSVTLYTDAEAGVAAVTPLTPDVAALTSMSQQLNDARTTKVALPADATVLTRDLTKEVFAVITYTAVRS
jgi:Tc toxin complex TcA C-terminal TcB-binding domain